MTLGQFKQALHASGTTSSSSPPLLPLHFQLANAIHLLAPNRLQTRSPTSISCRRPGSCLSRSMMPRRRKSILAACSLYPPACCPDRFAALNLVDRRCWSMVRLTPPYFVL
jgi:hypothetical protein